MIVIACLTCHLAIRTTGEPNELDFLVGTRSEWYPNRYPCPNSECLGKMTMTDAIESRVLGLLEVHDLSPQECFQALNGLGLPKERACDVGSIRKALQGRSIAFIDVQPVHNDKRSIVHSLLLDNGTRVYLASSPQGAMVYRIAPPRSVVREVLDGQ